VDSFQLKGILERAHIQKTLLADIFYRFAHEFCGRAAIQFNKFISSNGTVCV
jgi:hypothetical protein